MRKKTKSKVSDNMTTFTMRINRGVKKALEEAARQDRRSLAALFEKMGVDYLKAHGIPWREEYPSELQSAKAQSVKKQQTKVEKT